jgi:hypothetical protein
LLHALAASCQLPVALEAIHFYKTYFSLTIYIEFTKNSLFMPRCSFRFLHCLRRHKYFNRLIIKELKTVHSYAGFKLFIILPQQSGAVENGGFAVPK